jgi:hypothetical protein
MRVYGGHSRFGDARAARGRVGLLAGRFVQRLRHVEMMREPGALEQRNRPFGVAQAELERRIEVVGGGEPFIQPAQRLHCSKAAPGDR